MDRPRPADTSGPEQTVMLPSPGGRIAGTLHLADARPAPVVLLLHGFGGQRHELEIPALGIGIFEYAARAFASRGYSSLRIDFRGNGDSDGHFEDTTYSGQIADGLAALDFLVNDPSAHAAGVFIAGWSQGGLVAAALAGRTNLPAGVALWTSVGDPAGTFPALIGQDVFNTALAEGPASMDIDMPWGATLTLKRAFFEEVLTHNPLADIAQYQGPLFIAEGSKDTAIPHGAGAAFAAAHPGRNQLWVQPMDHIFNTAEGTQMLDRLIAETAAFFDAVRDPRL